MRKSAFREIEQAELLPCLCAQTRRVDRLLNRIYDDRLSGKRNNESDGRGCAAMLVSVVVEAGGSGWARRAAATACSRSSSACY